MSIIKSVAVFLLSAVFTMSLFMAINSYTIGDLLQKDNLKTFISSGMASDLIDSQCDGFCSKAEDKEHCLETCREDIGNQTDQTINEVIDNVYESDLYGVSIDQITSLMNQFALFVMIAIASGIATLFLSEEPLSTMGRNIISVSATLFITALSPNFVMSLSNAPLQSIFSEYMLRGLEQQKMFAIVLFAIAIVLIAAEYLIKRKKHKK